MPVCLSLTQRGHQLTGAAADDYVALATRPSISVESATKSIGLVKSAARLPSLLPVIKLAELGGLAWMRSPAWSGKPRI